MSEANLQISYSIEKSKECPICMNDIPKDQFCATNFCRHWFCYQCLIRWSETHNYCPVCRQINSVIIFINHLKYENDFELIIIDNKETIERKKLNSKRDNLIKRLLEENQIRLKQIEEMRQKLIYELDIHERIKQNIDKITKNDNQNNKFFEQILDEVRDDMNWSARSQLQESNRLSITGSEIPGTIEDTTDEESDDSSIFRWSDLVLF